MECSGRGNAQKINAIFVVDFNPSFSMECSGREMEMIYFKNIQSFNPSFSMECSGRFNGECRCQQIYRVSILVFQWNALEGNIQIKQLPEQRSFNPSFSMECSGRVIYDHRVNLDSMFQS
ncbi:hypothetical protein ZPR_1537 [Zunongwangia profunda SM-A87]|uniref:Uncharacterized protein n=1 Tax=Zunongwangia profunda (strain DSM 18752 / CCTCC AB 206139 / SM-A87) TaxID=655815 RepID=D5BKX3_ZUNPS|nr:hypothetical protein ZPR_1537 [Zunongwangia profunda SM-A87]|tara:strand:- start:2801 stop:3160 length:360 start_codon:yes stop_codon:yes gene_type:complete